MSKIKVPAPSVTYQRLVNQKKVEDKDVAVAAKGLKGWVAVLKDEQKARNTTSLKTDAYELKQVVTKLERIAEGKNPSRDEFSEDLVTALSKAEVTDKARKAAGVLAKSLKKDISDLGLNDPPKR